MMRTLLLISLLLALASVSKAQTNTAVPGSSFSCLATNCRGAVVSCNPSQECSLFDSPAESTSSLTFSNVGSSVFARCAITDGFAAVTHRDEEFGDDRVTVFRTDTGEEIQSITGGNGFGLGVDIEGDVMAIGAEMESPDGKIYIYQYNDTAGEFELTYTDETPSISGYVPSNTRFGRKTAVNPDGEFVAVLATQYNSGAAVFMYQADSNRNGNYSMVGHYYESSSANDMDMYGSTVMLGCENGVHELVWNGTALNKLRTITSDRTEELAFHGSLMVRTAGIDPPQLYERQGSEWTLVSSSLLTAHLSLDGSFVGSSDLISAGRLTEINNAESECRDLPEIDDGPGDLPTPVSIVCTLLVSIALLMGHV